MQTRSRSNLALENEAEPKLHARDLQRDGKGCNAMQNYGEDSRRDCKCVLRQVTAVAIPGWTAPERDPT